MSASKMMATLWSAAGDNLTDEQLTDLCCGDTVSMNLAFIAETMEGIAALVAADQGKVAGNFQSYESVANLLWGLSDVVRTSAEAGRIASDASGRLWLRGRAT